MESSFDPSTDFDPALLSGSWKLLFTINENAQTVDEINAKGFQVDTGVSKETYQNIYFSPSPTVENVIESADGNRVMVGGPIVLDEGSNRAFVSFTKLRVRKWGVNFSGGFLFRAINAVNRVRGKTRKDYLDTTFLDGVCRVGRGNKGSVFVLKRAEESGTGNGGEA